jgi:hypothetical protein
LSAAGFLGGGRFLERCLFDLPSEELLLLLLELLLLLVSESLSAFCFLRLGFFWGSLILTVDVFSSLTAALGFFSSCSFLSTSSAALAFSSFANSSSFWRSSALALRASRAFSRAAARFSSCSFDICRGIVVERRLIAIYNLLRFSIRDC